MGTKTGWKLAIGGVALGALAIVPLDAGASTSATNTLTISAGTLSILTMNNATLGPVALSAGTVSGGLNAGQWSDLTGSGAGWHGSIAVSSFQNQGAWTPVGAAPALTLTTSGNYNPAANVADALITVTVSAGGTATNTPFAWTDREGGTTTNGTVATCTNGSACAVSNGVTITFNAATTYSNGTQYTARVGLLPTSALSTHQANGSISASGTTQGGSNLPAFLADAAVASATGAGNFGSAVNFVSAAANTGEGLFNVTPGGTVTWDPNLTWSGSWVATAQYTITSGP